MGKIGEKKEYLLFWMYLNINQTPKELLLWKRQNWSWAAKVCAWRLYWNYGPVSGEHSESSDGGLWEGNSEVVILSKIVIVKLNKGLDCFFHRPQLNECHLTILPIMTRKKIKSTINLVLNQTTLQNYFKKLQTMLNNVNYFWKQRLTERI